MSGGGGGDAPEVKETAEQKALAQVAAERYNHYQEVFVPLENQFMQRVDERNTKAAHNVAQGLTHTAYQAQKGKGMREATERALASGIDPSSGRTQAGIGGAATDMAGAQGSAEAQAGVTQSDRHVAGLQNVVALGNNQAGQSIAGLGDIAQVSGAKAAQDAQLKFSDDMSKRQAIATMAGAAVSVAGGWKGSSAPVESTSSPGPSFSLGTGKSTVPQMSPAMNKPWYTP